MLYSMLIRFQAQADAVISPTRGYYAYALFLDLLRRSNGTVAQQLHDLDGPKPFTVSPLEGSFRRQQSGLKVADGGIYWIRYTFLKADLFAYFLDAAMKSGGQTLRLDQAALRIHEIVTAPGASLLCDCCELEDIFSNAQTERRISLEFLSPTTFRSGGQRNILFPEPRMLFNSYLSRWQSFSSINLDTNLVALAETGARIASYKLDSRALHFGAYSETGFQGKCAIEIGGEMTKEVVRELNALADFAFYCGTGAKTSMGMGQTRRLVTERAP